MVIWKTCDWHARNSHGLKSLSRMTWTTMIAGSTLCRLPGGIARIWAAWCRNYGHTSKKHDWPLGQRPFSPICLIYRSPNPYIFDTPHVLYRSHTSALSLQQQIPRIQIPLLRPLDNLLSDRPALSIWSILKALPEALGREPVAKILLVEARLATTGCIPFQWPVARRVGCERLVDKDELAANEPKLELGVCDDETACGRMLRSSGVQLQSDLGYSVV